MKIAYRTIQRILSSAQNYSSQRSDVYLLGDKIIIESIIPFSNITVINLPNNDKIETPIKLGYTTFSDILEVADSDIDIILSSSKLSLIAIFSSKKVSTSNFILLNSFDTSRLNMVMDHTILEDKYSVNITNLIQLAKVHYNNIGNIDTLSNINGLFIGGDIVYSTNAYAAMSSKLDVALNADMFVHKHMLSMFKTLGSEVRLYVSENKAALSIPDITVFFNGDVLQPNFVMLKSLENLMDGFIAKVSIVINVPALRSCIDKKALKFMASRDMSMVFRDDELFIKARGSDMIFDANIKCETFQEEEIEFKFPTDEMVKLFDLISDYATLSINYDGDRKVQFAFGENKFLLSMTN